MGVTPISGTAHVLLLTFIIAAPQPRCPSIVFWGENMVSIGIPFHPPVHPTLWQTKKKQLKIATYSGFTH